MQSKTVKDHIDNFLSRKFRKSRSFATTRSYKNIIKKFQEFLALQYNLDVVELLSVIESDDMDPLDVLDEYYTFLSTYQRKDSAKPYANSTIKDYVTTAKEFLNSMGCKIYVEDMKRKFTLPKRSIPYEEGLTKEAEFEERTAELDAKEKDLIEKQNKITEYENTILQRKIKIPKSPDLNKQNKEEKEEE